MVTRARVVPLLAPGDICGDRFAIERRIEQGPAWETYLATCRRTGARAILTCSDFRHVAGDAPDEPSFLARASRLSAREHEGLAEALGVGVERGLFWIASARADAIPIHEAISRGADGNPFAMLTEVLIAAGLAAESLIDVTAAGLVHGDVCPERLFVDRKAGLRVLVVGFGHAELFQLDHAAARLTPRYRSPEQLRGEPLNARSDIYSFGMVLYGLIAGAPPFGLHEGAELLALAEGRMPEPLVEATGWCPPLVQQLVERAIAKAPEDRFESWEQLADTVAALLTLLLGDSPTFKALVAEVTGGEQAPSKSSSELVASTGPQTVAPSPETRGRIKQALADAVALHASAAFAARRRSDDEGVKLRRADAGDASVGTMGAPCTLSAPSTPSTPSTPSMPDTPAPEAQRPRGARVEVVVAHPVASVVHHGQSEAAEQPALPAVPSTLPTGVAPRGVPRWPSTDPLPTLPRRAPTPGPCSEERGDSSRERSHRRSLPVALTLAVLASTSIGSLFLRGTERTPLLSARPALPVLRAPTFAADASPSPVGESASATLVVRVLCTSSVPSTPPEPPRQPSRSGAPSRHPPRSGMEPEELWNWSTPQQPKR